MYAKVHVKHRNTAKPIAHIHSRLYTHSHTYKYKPISRSI